MGWPQSGSLDQHVNRCDGVGWAEGTWSGYLVHSCPGPLIPCTVRLCVVPYFPAPPTDDQDDLLNSTHPHYMPALNKHLAAEGTRVTDFIVSTPLCCPARTSLFTGEYAHCT